LKNKYKCPAVLCTPNDISKAKLVIEHYHAGNRTTLEVEKFKHKIKNRAKISSDKPSQIFAEAVSDLPNEVLMNIPNESSVKRVIQNQRSNLNPTKPTSLEDLKIEGK